MSNIIAERPGWYIRNKWFVWWGVLFGIVGAIGVAIWCAEPPDRPALAINALIALATLALVLATIQYNHKHLAEITGKASLAVLNPSSVPNSSYLAPFAPEQSAPDRVLVIDCAVQPPTAAWTEVSSPSGANASETRLRTDAMFFRLPIKAIKRSVEQVEIFANELRKLDAGEWTRVPQWIPSPLCWGWPPPTVTYESLAAGSIRPWHFGFVLDPRCQESIYRRLEDTRPQLYILVRDASHTRQNLLPCGRYKMVIELSAKGATASKWEVEFELHEGWTEIPDDALTKLLVFQEPREIIDSPSPVDGLVRT